MLKRIALLTISLVVIGGCAQQGRWTRADYDLGYDQPPLESQLKDVSARIYLVSDNQRHGLLGNGVAIFRNSFSDKYISKVAIRPPQLDLYGQDLLGEALAMTDGFVLHLGDACDISNTAEFGRFAWDMRAAPNGWVMAPGNHDGFFFGNSSRTVPGLIREWNEAAESYVFDGATITSHAMQKDRFVSYYIAALVLQDAIWSGPLARTLGPDVEKRYARWSRRDSDSRTAAAPSSFTQYWKEMEGLQEEIYRASDVRGDQPFHLFELSEDAVPAGQPHLRRVAWQIDKEHVWRSYVLQEVDISAASAAAPSDRKKMSILVFDSAQYGVQPSFDHGIPSKFFSKLSFGYFDFQVAGENGNVLPSQEQAANAFTTSMMQEGRRWMLASHHPYDTLGRATKPRFDRFRDAGSIPVTLSAHTHSGEIRWNHDGGREGDWLEINVGSILDSPVEFRDLQVRSLGDRIVISSRRQSLADALRERGLIDDDDPLYRPVPGDADFYLGYTSGMLGTASEADFKVKRILLAAYLRLFSLFEADYPDQSSTYWPTGPDGTTLRSHADVISAIRDMLADVSMERIDALTRFLYELREFDRTRRFSDETAQQLRSYRISQAIWASGAEYTTFKTKPPEMDPDLSLFVLPRPAVAQQATH